MKRTRRVYELTNKYSGEVVQINEDELKKFFDHEKRKDWLIEEIKNPSDNWRSY